MGPPFHVQGPVVPGVHVPVLQVSPERHGAHVAPAFPHELPLFWLAYGSQAAPLQQPVGQEAASQTHAPPAHWVPLAHALQAAPATPQVPLPEG